MGTWEHVFVEGMGEGAAVALFHAVIGTEIAEQAVMELRRRMSVNLAVQRARRAVFFFGLVRPVDSDQGFTGCQGRLWSECSRFRRIR